MNEFNYDEYKARREEEVKDFKALAAEKFPSIDFNEWELSKNEVFDGEFTSKDGRKKIVVSTLHKYCFETNTYYGHVIEELKEAGRDYTVLEGSYADTLIEWRGTFAAVQKFNRHNGEKVKGVKLLRDTHENKRGIFITLDRKRIYKGDK